MLKMYLERQKREFDTLFHMKVMNQAEQISLTSNFVILFIIMLLVITLVEFRDYSLNSVQLANRFGLAALINFLVILMRRGVRFTREALLIALQVSVAYLLFDMGTVTTPISFLILFIVAASPLITNFRGLLFSYLTSILIIFGLVYAESTGMILQVKPISLPVATLILFVSITLAAGFATIVVRRYDSYYAALKKSDQAIEQSPLSIVITNRESIIEYVNPRFSEVTGYSKDEVMGRNPRFLSAKLKPPEFYTEMYNTLKSGEIWQGDFINVRKDGKIYYEQSTICPILDHENNITHFMALKEDITKRKEAELNLLTAKEQLEVQLKEITNLKNRLQHQALHDQLTGLFNRRYLSEFVEREFDRIKRLKQPLTILAIDLDHFKRVNDTYGHRAGDQVLITMSELITRKIRKVDICCRYGGEEFIVVMPGANNEIGFRRAEELRQQVKQMTVHFMEDQINVTISVGVATYPDHALSMEEVIAHADTALYASKNKGRDVVSIWEPGMLIEQFS